MNLMHIQICVGGGGGVYNLVEDHLGPQCVQGWSGGKGYKSPPEAMEVWEITAIASILNN